MALDLHRGYLSAQINARMAVKWQRTNHPGIFTVSRFSSRSRWSRTLARLARRLEKQKYFRGQFTLQDWLAEMASPSRLWGKICGSDNYSNSECEALARWPDGWQPDVIHAHNLHGRYFDLSALSTLGRHAPIVATLHDTWLITGHCGYFVDCDRWRKGCGRCPDLRRYPAIFRDRTFRNAVEKRNWLRACERLHLITPSEWLRKLIAEAKLPCASLRCIHNGVDLKTFHPAMEPRNQLRQRLGLPEECFLVLGVAASLSAANVYKDPQTLLAVCEKLAAVRSPRIHCVLLGAGKIIDSGPGVTFAGYVRDRQLVANYYRAADVFIHTAHADNFPCTVLESQACGTPVVATAVGGVPEQIKDGCTGILAERGNVEQIVNRVLAFAAQADRSEWRNRTSEHVRDRFDLEVQVARYLNVLTFLREQCKAST